MVKKKEKEGQSLVRGSRELVKSIRFTQNKVALKGLVAHECVPSSQVPLYL